jgi:Autophagy receptor ATG43
MSDSTPLQVAETIQTASINPSLELAHGTSLTTATSTNQPLTIPRASHGQLEESSYGEVGLDDIDDGDNEDEADAEDISYDVILPLPRRASLPPLPDLRFEQSYLASIAGATTYWKVAYITIRDQVRVYVPPSLISPPLSSLCLSACLCGAR